VAGLTLDVLTVWVGLGLILGGVARALGGIRGTADQWVTAVVSGLASVVFGVLALSWPDVTILVIAVVFGAWAAVAGLVLLAAAFRQSPQATASPAPGPGRIRRWWRTLRAAGELVVAVTLLAVSAFWHEASPSPDSFYAAPAHVPSSPGALLRVEPFTTGIPPDARLPRDG
jgi:Short repeat of unknown function (DUF308)